MRLLRVALILFSPHSVLAQTNFWQLSGGPTTAVNSVITIYVDNVGQIFLGPGDQQGLYQSRDNGLSWSKLSYPGFSAKVIAFNRLGHIFVGGSLNGLYRSADDGLSWIKVFPFPNVPLVSIKTIALNNRGEMFMAADSGDATFAYGLGVFKSTDDGITWLSQSNGLSYRCVYQLVTNDSGDLFAATAGGVFRSTDDGGNWNELNMGLSNIAVNALLVTKSGTIFASVTEPASRCFGVRVIDHGWIYRSVDNGASWSNVLTMSSDFGTSLATDSLGTIFAGTARSRMLRSTDAGDSWSTLEGFSNLAGGVNSIALSKQGVLFVGTGQRGLFRSTNGGETWTKITVNVPLGVARLIINRAGHILAGRLGSVLRSTDNGANWTEMGTGLPYADLTALLVDSSGGLLAGTVDGVFRLADSSGAWIDVSSGMSSRLVWVLAISSKGHIFAGTDNGGVFRSTDSGRSWMATGLVSTHVRSLAINSSGHVFAGTLYTGVFRSTDDGATWNAVGPTLLRTASVSSLAIIASGNIYAGTYDGRIFRSSDNGASWTVMGLTTAKVSSLGVNSSGYVFAGTSGTGVYRSRDNGTTWTPTNTGLTSLNVASLAIDSTGYIWAGTDGGVFRSFHSTTLNRPPISFSILSPSVKDTIKLTLPAKPISFNWHQATDPDPDDILSYTLRLSGRDVDTTIGAIKDTAVSLNIMMRLKPGGVFHWFVLATDGLSETSSDTSAFSTSPFVVSVEESHTDISNRLIFFQNYPNPFNPSTTIEFALPKSTFVTLRVYDLLGRQVGELVNEKLGPGNYKTQWDARGLASGVYFYRFQSGEFTDTRKLILLR